MYSAPQNIPRAIRVLTLGNKVILYCIVCTPPFVVVANSVRRAMGGSSGSCCDCSCKKSVVRLLPTVLEGQWAGLQVLVVTALVRSR